MSKKIAIIGGGIIGLYIGWKLSQKGDRVVLFEKKTETEADFKCCSGLVSERINNFIPLDDTFIENEIKSCKINFPKKQIELIFNPKHSALDREKVIRELIRLNKEAGTEIKFGYEIKEIPVGFDKLIFCDGANSLIRKSNNKKQFFRLGAQLVINEKNSNNFVETTYINSGFCWRIPRGDTIEYGIVSKPDILVSEFDSFLKSFNKSKSLGIYHSAVIPQPLSFNSLFFSEDKNVFLCGDALGLVKPWSGGGIIWNLTAADILLKNIDDSSKYKKELKRKFSWQILKGRISNSLVCFIGRRCPFLLPSKIIYDNDFPSIIKTLFRLIKKVKSANV
ncbi:NAD(P)/FAD-dependent oxidoreductase [bacterium]|nr:NAD(P)/FAD-dependent oxidoreductase [bacterium]